MRIEIRFCNSLAAGHLGGAAFSLALPAGSTLADALERMNLRSGRLAMVLCNGESVFDDSGQLDGTMSLRDGDHLVLSSNDPTARRQRPSLWAPLRQISSLLSPLMQSR